MILDLPGCSKMDEDTINVIISNRKNWGQFIREGKLDQTEWPEDDGTDNAITYQYFGGGNRLLQNYRNDYCDYWKKHDKL